MGLRILRKGILPPDGPLDVSGRHLAFFRQRVHQYRQALAMEAVEEPILDPPTPYPQLIDAIAQIVGFWAAQFVPQHGQALDPSDASRVGAPVASSQCAEPVKYRHLAIRFLVEHDGSLGHRIGLRGEHKCLTMVPA